MKTGIKKWLFCALLFALTLSMTGFLAARPGRAQETARNNIAVSEFGTLANGFPFIRFNMGTQAPYDKWCYYINTSGNDAINDFLLVDGEPYACSDWGQSNFVHQALDSFYFYESFAEGTTIELKPGMAFAADSWSGGVPLSGDTLGTGLTIVKANGVWIDSNAVGDAKLMALGAIEETGGTLEVAIGFDRLITAEAHDVTDSEILGGVSVGEKTLVQLRGEGSEFSLHADRNALILALDAAEFQADGLRLSVAKNLKLPNGNQGKNGTSKYYLAAKGRWVTNYFEKLVPDGTKKMYFSDASDNFQPKTSGNGSTVKLSIRFRVRYSVSDQILNFYASDPDWLYETPTTGRSEESIDRALCDGTYDSLLENLLLDETPISGFNVQIHYSLDSLELYIPAANYDLRKSHTISLKKELYFPSGYVMGRDVNVLYTPEDGGFTDIAVEGIELGETTAEIGVNEEYALKAGVLPCDAAVSKLKYEVISGSEFVTVNKLGVATGISEGTAVVRVTALGNTAYSDTVTVRCSEIALSSVSLSKKNETLLIGTELNLDVIYSPVNASYRGVTFTSSNPSVATVDENGRVVTVGAGEAIVRAVSVFDESIQAEFKVTVVRVVTSIRVTPPDKTNYLLGENFNDNGLTITVTYDDGTQEVLPRTKAKVTGYSKSTPGDQVINVIYEGQSDSFVVTVSDEKTGCGSMRFGDFGGMMFFGAVIAAGCLLVTRRKGRQVS